MIQNVSKLEATGLVQPTAILFEQACIAPLHKPGDLNYFGNCIRGEKVHEITTKSFRRCQLGNSLLSSLAGLVLGMQLYP